MSELTFRELQRNQKEWSDRNFGEQVPYHCLLGAVEEIGELAHAHLKSVQGIRGMTRETYLSKARDAVADVIVFLAGYCSAEGIDLQDAITEVSTEVFKRDWASDPDKGGMGAGSTSAQDDKHALESSLT